MSRTPRPQKVTSTSPEARALAFILDAHRKKLMVYWDEADEAVINARSGWWVDQVSFHGLTRAIVERLVDEGYLLREEATQGAAVKVWTLAPGPLLAEHGGYLREVTA